MKYFLLLSFFITQSLMAKSILLSGFDAFNGAQDNNSQKIAKLVQEKFQNSDIKIHFCQLRTVYYKSSEELKDCFNSLEDKPEFIISLGEGLCSGIEFEIKARNQMKSVTPDNDGVVYRKQEIIPGGARSIQLPLSFFEIYKSMSKEDKRFVSMSKDPGKFVCNNLAYLMGHNFSEVPFGFIHVPAHTCPRQKENISHSVVILQKVIHSLFN